MHARMWDGKPASHESSWCFPSELSGIMAPQGRKNSSVGVEVYETGASPEAVTGYASMEAGSFCGSSMEKNGSSGATSNSLWFPQPVISSRHFTICGHGPLNSSGGQHGNLNVYVPIAGTCCGHGMVQL